jgi:solute carrier family 10 (sodium/bile acid cotransporter), member 7
VAKLTAFRPDPYVVGILASVAVAAVAPVSGGLVGPFSIFTKVVIGLLFFLYGARLAREAVLAGLMHWRLHLFVLVVTFGFFPLVGAAVGQLLSGVFTSGLLLTGVLYLTCLPSTIQSSVAFVATARGAVAAAVCTASASNLIGVIVTPLLVGVILRTQGVHVPVSAMESIVIQVLLPFIAGQLVHPWLGPWTARHGKWLMAYDRGSIFLLVYGAFSAAVVAGVWKQISLRDLALVALFDAVLLAIVLLGITRLARRLGFAVEDEIVIAFCGSQKGLATGVPLAGLLFPAPQVGLILVPVMLYHQFQLISCAVLAQRYARRSPT